MKKSLKWTLVVAVAVPVAWIVVALLISKNEPNIAVDYLALLNAPVLALEENDRAWPGIREAFGGFREAVREHDMQGSADLDGLIYRRLEDGFEWNVAPLRDALGKPGLGMLLTTGEFSKEDAAFFGGTVTRASTLGSSSLDGSLMSVQLPAFMILHRCGQILAEDARRAIEVGEIARFRADVEAIFELGRHSREGGLLIGYLVSMSIDTIGFEALFAALSENEKFFSDADLVALAQRVASLTGARANIDLLSERYYFDDIVQRVFTDDGYGGGSLGRNSFDVMSMTPDNSVMRFLTSPLVAVVGPSRLEVTQIYHAMMDQIQARLDAPTTDTGVQSYIFNGYDLANLSFIQQMRLFPIPLLMPSLDKAAIELARFRMNRDAILAAVELIQHKRAWGTWPEAVDDTFKGRFDGKPFEVLMDEETFSITATNSSGATITLWTTPLK